MDVGYYLGSFIGLIVWGIIWGFATKTVNENKGYYGGFWLGFWLGFIGLIIVATKPENRSGNGTFSLLSEAAKEKNGKSLLSSGGWKCSKCGRVNPSYAGTCGCGMSKSDNEANRQAAQQIQISTADEIKKLKELCDSGVITQEEFDAKKKQLLGLSGNKEIDTPKEAVVIGANADAATLLKRAFMFLEDGEWSKADAYCEQVLNQDPENAQAYLGKLMAELHVRHQEDLSNCKQPFDNSNNFQKAVRFGGEAFAGVLSSYIDHINERNESTHLTGIYDGAVSAMKAAKTESAYKAAAKAFKTIPGFQDADDLAEQCLDKGDVCRKDALYDSAHKEQIKNKITGYESAIKLYESIPGWKDADEQLEACQRKIEELKAKEEADRLERERQEEQRRIAEEAAAKKRKIIIAIVSSIAIVSIVFIIVLTKVIIPKQKLNTAISLLDSGDYDAAYALLEELGKDDEITSNKYDRAMALINSGDYDAAYALLEEIGNRDAIASSKYDRAVALIDSGDYVAAYILLNDLDYKDSASLRKTIEHSYAWFKICPIGGTGFFGTYEQDNNTSNGKEDIEWIVLAREGDRVLVVSRYALDCQPYNTSEASVTWENCSLRKWLNGTFMNDAFSESERAMIPSVTVSADKNPEYTTSPGSSTTDHVFLLSITEANRYFSSMSSRECQGTAYCNAQGAYIAKNGNCFWCLRSPGFKSDCVAHVRHDGDIENRGNAVESDDRGVRPALWIEL